jgi:chromosome segregation ATPase
LEVFQINIALHTSLLGLTIELYSAQLEGINAIISAYNAYIGASLAEHGAELATLDVTRAQLQSNQAKISMYQAQGRTESVRASVYETAVEQDTLPIEEFTTYIDGLLQNVDIMKLNIAAYRDSLQIQSEAVKIDKASIAAYADQIRASGSALEVYDANWDLYDTAYSAAAQTSNATQQFNSASLQALTGEIGVFRSAAEQQNAYLRAITTWTEERSQIISQYSSTVSQMANYVESKNSSTTSLEEARSRINLAKADNAAIQSALDAQRDAAQAAVDGGLLAATATTMSGAAQAAYSMRSLSASMASSAGDTTSTSGDTSAAETTDYNRQYAYNKTQSLTA